MSEGGANWKHLLGIVMLGIGWYGYNNYEVVRKHFLGKTIEREQAYEICTEVCQNNNNLIIGALVDKGYIDPSPDNAIKDVINDVCASDCNKRISP